MIYTMDKKDELHASSNDEKTSSNDEHFVAPNKGRNIKKDSPDKNKLDRTKDEGGDDNMELVRKNTSFKGNTYSTINREDARKSIKNCIKKYDKDLRDLAK